MFKNPVPFEERPSKIHTDSPVSLRKETTESLLTETPLAGNISAASLLSSFPAHKVWEVQEDALRKWQDSHRSSLTD